MDWLHTLLVMDTALREREREVEQAARLSRLYRDLPAARPGGTLAAREWLRGVFARPTPPAEQPCCSPVA